MESQLTLERIGVSAEVGDGGWWMAVDVRLLASVGLIVAAVLIRWLVSYWVRRRATFLTDLNRRTIAFSRNGSTLAVLAGLLILWSPELSEFALSLTAFAVAIVIATKELIMCFAGGLVRGVSGSFSSGDWIEIGPHSGEVTDQNLVTTTLMEIDPVNFANTGRSVTLPNSMFLLNPVVNHRHRKRFVHHEFAIGAEPMPDALAARDAIREGLEHASTEFRDVAERYAQFIEHRMSLKLPGVAPEVRIRTTEFGKMRFEARLFCPRDRAAEMEDRAMEAFLAWTQAQPWSFAGTVHDA
ncbi:MAG: small-conductance mechanosensitive channel [Paracoccaceae bacterium]|jgi:small-conductance mechanosensitive channel